MSPQKDVLLAKIHVSSNRTEMEREIRVVAQRTYGLVAPGELTTNGSALALVLGLPFWRIDADCAALGLRYEWTAVHPLVPAELGRPEDLYEALVRAYAKEFPTEALLEGLERNIERGRARLRERFT